VFPTDEEGVAQGSPLSPLFGNILLYDFDREFNGRGLICVRFIDDFILLGDSERSVIRGFDNAKSVLQGIGPTCHDPFFGKPNPEKSCHGKVDNGFVFLGYDIRPGLFSAFAVGSSEPRRSNRRAYSLRSGGDLRGEKGG
jgi:hypothetical protein